MPPLPNTHKDLVFSKRAEHQFLEAYSPWIENNTGDTSKSKKWAAPDFITLSGDLVELKADRYTSGNFFLEEFSNVKTKKPGGVWQAKEKGVRYLAYWFVNESRWFLFEIDELLTHLESTDLKPYAKRTRKGNIGYCTSGYAIPIKELEHLAVGEYELEYKGKC